MKRRINKDLIVIVTLIPVLLWGAFLLSTTKENTLPRYSTLSKSESGYSVFYEALKEFKYTVKRTLSPVEDQTVDTVQIVAASGDFNINDPSIQKWVRNGGNLVFLSNNNQQIIQYGVLPEYVGSGVATYKCEKGRILAADAAALTNGTLSTDAENAYVILKNINASEKTKIYFNESYMFAIKQEKSLWGAMPAGVKLVIYQIILTAIAYVVYKGRRFGRPVQLYEEVERVENEYLFSASSLYRQARCWDLIVDSFYKSLLRLMKSEHDVWLSKWEREGLPDLGKANKVYTFMNALRSNRGVKPKAEEYEQIISLIDQLKSELKKRRDLQWNTLKKI